MEHADSKDWSRGLGHRRPLRKYPRVHVELAAEYTADPATKAKPGKVLTIGGGGLFLGLGESIAAGTEISIRFRPGPRLPMVRAKAKVLYQVPNHGIGLEFLGITPEHQQAILRLIHQKM